MTHFGRKPVMKASAWLVVVTLGASALLARSSPVLVGPGPPIPGSAQTGASMLWIAFAIMGLLLLILFLCLPVKPLLGLMIGFWCLVLLDAVLGIVRTAILTIVGRALLWEALLPLVTYLLAAAFIAAWGVRDLLRVWKRTQSGSEPRDAGNERSH